MKDSQPNQEVFSFCRIATIQSGYPDKFAVPRQSGIVNSVSASIVFDPSLQPEISLQGLERFTHVWIFFVFHLNQSKGFHAKVHPPRLNGESIGVFATRSPHRPNPIGLSLVKILKVHSDRVDVEGIDLVDGTPVLDIKPYLPQFEIRLDAKAGWVEENPNREITVDFEPATATQMQAWSIESGRSDLKTAIIEILRQDPRPVVYKGFEETGGKYREDHVFRLYDYDVRFKFVTADHAIVTSVTKFQTRDKK